MSKTLKNQTEAYKAYIAEHKANVQIAYDLMIDDIVERFAGTNIIKLKRRIKEHDLSKYSTEEFEPYRQKFFPCEGETPNEELFKKAWEHHYQVNDHHPEYWIKDGKVQEMSTYALIEMLCDWVAMSIKFNNCPSKWFEDSIKKKKLVLHESTELIVRMNINMLDNAWLNSESMKKK